MGFSAHPLKKQSKFFSKRAQWIIGVSILLFLVYVSTTRAIVVPFASHVEAYKIESEGAYLQSLYSQRLNTNVPWPPKGAVMVDDCRVVSGPQLLDAGFVQRLNFALMDPTAFQRDHSRCIMEPGFMFRTWKGKMSMDVLLCLHCNQLLTITRDEQGHETSRRYGTLGSRLKALVQEVFPNDPLFHRP